ncbi:hypothetical protein FPV67DRAFT_1699320 [Lyophyllum atratum]|nr:hypothetical protein FPV67DRAFT_1699320 [Lyophyllum atratum]
MSFESDKTLPLTYVRESGNDVNEGALGGYRVTIRGKPSLTLHQYNALAMFKHNETQAYMDVTYHEEDHQFIRREARRMDASGLEKKRRKELVDFRVEVAHIRKGKELAKQQKIREDSERLSKVKLITKVEDIYDEKWNLTVAKLGEQIDAFRFIGLPDVPAKSRFSKKADRQEALKEIFQRYQCYILEHGPLFPPTVVETPQIADDWEAEEEDEMDE